MADTVITTVRPAYRAFQLLYLAFIVVIARLNEDFAEGAAR